MKAENSFKFYDCKLIMKKISPTSEVEISTLPTLSTYISQLLKPDIIRSKLTSAMVESLCNEVFNIVSVSNLLASTAALADPTSNVLTVRGLLVDLSLTFTTALQNYLRYRNSKNWKCDEESCELMDIINLDSILLPSIDPSATHPLDGALVMTGTLPGTVVSFLITSEDASTLCSPFLPLMAEVSGHPSWLSMEAHSPAPTAAAGGLWEAKQTPPSPPPPSQSLSVIGRYCMVSLLVNLFSHQLMPMLLQFVENSIQHIYIA